MTGCGWACTAELPERTDDPQTVDSGAAVPGADLESNASTGRPSRGADSIGGEIALDDASFARLETAIEDAIVQYSIPGAAVAVTGPDRTLWQRGFGFRHVRRGQGIDEDTLFRIGGVTRALTATMIAAVVDQDRLEWNALASWAHLDAVVAAPVETVPVATAPVAAAPVVSMPVDALSIAPGSEHDEPPLPGSEIEDFVADAHRATAGFAGPGGASGALYRRSMQEALFGPAGMVHTAIADRLPAMSENFATPYATDLGGRPVEGDFPDASDTAPYDGAASTVGDLARFLRLQANAGIAASGQRVVSASNLDRSRRGMGLLAARAREAWPLAVDAHRSLGWTEVDLAGGARWLGQSGGREGFAAEIGFFVESGLGLVVLTNLEPTLGGRAFCREVRDFFLAEVARALGASLSAVTRRSPEDLSAEGVVEAGGIELSFGAHRARHRQTIERLRSLERETRPVQPARVRPFLGQYAAGWSLALYEGRLELRRELTVFPLSGHRDGGYLVAEGPSVGARVRLESAGSRPFVSLLGPDGQAVRIDRLD